MQIAFLTLFLGLVTGPQTVVVDAGPGVKAVELLLDGRSAVVKLGRPPWTTQVDLGPALLPHHLEARGHAAHGSVAAHAEQWLYLPRPPAEVDIVLEGSGEARKRTARLTWDSLTGKAPSKVQLSLDGVPLALDSQARAALAIPRAGAAHVLSARLSFAGGLEARKEMVLTGDYGGDVATELTAVPVRVAGPAKSGQPLTPAELRGRFLADGRPAAVAAVEREPPEVFVVRAVGAETMLFGRVMRVGSSAYIYGHFEVDQRIRFHFVSPVARHAVERGTASEVFDISQAFLAERSDLARLLLAVRFDVPGRPQLADAVAVAGQHALDRQTPRAVVLLAGRGDGAQDGSRFPPAAVRAYLAAAGVPFFVWSTARGSLRPEDWGPIADVSTPQGLHDAYQQLEREVLAQQIVWLEGRHLPQSITLAPAAVPAGAVAPGAAGAPGGIADRLQLVSTGAAP
jgi:hypothetical protein